MGNSAQLASFCKCSIRTWLPQTLPEEWQVTSPGVSKTDNKLPEFDKYLHQYHNYFS